MLRIKCNEVYKGPLSRSSLSYGVLPTYLFSFTVIPNHKTFSILLEHFILVQLVSFPSPKTYVISQTFLSSLAGTPICTASPISLLSSLTSTSSSKLSSLSCQKVDACRTSVLLGHLPCFCLSWVLTYWRSLPIDSVQYLIYNGSLSRFIKRWMNLLGRRQSNQGQG